MPRSPVCLSGKWSQAFLSLPLVNYVFLLRTQNFEGLKWTWDLKLLMQEWPDCFYDVTLPMFPAAHVPGFLPMTCAWFPGFANNWGSLPCITHELLVSGFCCLQPRFRFLAPGSRLLSHKLVSEHVLYICFLGCKWHGHVLTKILHTKGI